MATSEENQETNPASVESRGWAFQQTFALKDGSALKQLGQELITLTDALVDQGTHVVRVEIKVVAYRPGPKPTQGEPD